ncbi:MAG: invasion associated locus B family protein [Methylobacteriaceae bacterium]|jgi:invasion protein IalB|nr:invasion associated locus B family protein [Methylobacteriaceae bacterium]
MTRILTKAACVLALSLAPSFAVRAQDAAVTTSVSNWGPWFLRCTTRVDDGKTFKNCQIDFTKTAKQNDGREIPYLGVIVQRFDPTKPLKIRANVPLMSIIPAGVKVQDKDKKDITVLSFDMCRGDMCETSADLTDAQVKNLLKITDNMNVTFRAFGQEGKLQDITSEIPMKGFAEAYAAMMKEMPAPSSKK